MTSPSGHNDINLAALWIPVMPETSHMGEEMRKAGGEAKRAFEQGFNSSGSSPESLGNTYIGKFRESMSKGFNELEIPFGGSKVAEWFDKFSGDVDEKVVNKLKGKATEALRTYAAEHEKLVAAQDRVTESENKLNQARDNGFNKASIMMPLMAEQTAAHTALEEATKRTATAHEQLTTATGRLNEEQAKAATGGQMMAGVMGGLVVVGAGLALKAVEEFADMVKEGFEGAIEITKELAEQTLELGDKYEQIGIGIREFSTASGEEFEKLESNAQRVFGSLDVAGANTGQTMAQLSSILGMEAGPALDRLVKHVEELQGRFSGLKSQDVASIFYAFKVPAEETDSVLASLTQSARESGHGIDELVSALKGDAAEVLHQAGLNAQQAGAFIGDLMKMGAGGRNVMSGLQTLMKEAGKEGISFGEGMKLAGQRLKELGDTAEGQELAEKLFGTRRWATAMQAVQDYVDVVAKGPDAFNASSDSLDQFLQQTQTLQNKWEEVKHKIEEALMPLGMGALDVAGGFIDSIKNSFDQRLPEIRAQVKSIGDSFIDNLPVIRDFVAGGISIMGPLFDFIKEGMLLVSGTLGGLVDIYAQVTGDDKLHESMVKFGEAQKKLQDIDFTKLGDNVSSFVSSIGVDSDDIKKKFDAMWDSARGEGADQQSPGAPLPDIGAGIQRQASAFSDPTPMAGGGGSFGGAASTSGTGGYGAPGGMGNGVHHADWDAIAQKESSGNWADHDSGHNGHYGGLQFLPSTWTMYGGGEFASGADQATKEQQITIAERILNGWNGIPGQGPGAWPDTYVGFSRGGSPSNAPGRAVTSGSGNGDDVPALLGRGEYVWDTDTVDKYGWLISALHDGSLKGFDQGGPTDGLDTKGAQVDTIAVAEAAKQLFGITDIGMYRSADGYNEHASGEAADVMVGNSKDTGDAVAQYFLQNAGQFGVQYVLWQQTQWNPDGSKSKMEDRGSPTANHMDHVHVRTLGGGFPQGADQSGFASPSTGQTSNTPSPIAMGLTGGAGSTPGGKNGGAFPGLAGQYGGLGVYGGQTADQAFSSAQAVQEAHDQLDDKNHAVDLAQRRVDDLTAKLNAPPGPDKVGLLTGLPLDDPKTAAAEAQKHKELEEQLSDATYQLTVARREAGEQVGKVSEAERKQQESALKKPTGAKGGNKDAQSLGSGLLEGIGQELGFGDVFGKSPLDWGIVKLAEGLFNYGNNLGDAIFGKTDSGGGMFGATPGGGQGLGADLGTGVLGSLGIKLPSASAISAAPNVIPAPPGSPLSGAGTGPLPGPPVINNDNSIHVSSDVSDTKVLGPVQEQQNSSNGHSFQYSGGFPAP
jgi:hypothetical protein